MFKYLSLFLALYTGYQLYNYEFNGLVLSKSTIFVWGLIVFIDFTVTFFRALYRERINKTIEEIRNNPDLTEDDRTKLYNNLIVKELNMERKPKE